MKHLSKIRSNIYLNKNLFVFLFVLVLVGIIAGSVFTLIISSDDKALVTDYLNNFFENASASKLDYNNSLINIIIFTLGFALLIWALGFSVIGFVIVLFMLFMKAFILGFSVSSIMINFKFKGALYALVYAFPHHIINILVFMVLSGYALMVSFKLVRLISGKTQDFKNIINKYTITLVVCLFILLFTSLYEIYAMPYILNFILSVVKI